MSTRTMNELLLRGSNSPWPSEAEVNAAIDDLQTHHAAMWRMLVLLCDDDPEGGVRQSVHLLFQMEELPSARVLAKVWRSVYRQYREAMNKIYEVVPMHVSDAAEEEEVYGALPVEDSPLVQDLLPIFRNDAAVAREFADRASAGLEGRYVARLVQDYLDRKKINPDLVHRPLYRVLLKHGIYDKKENTWNRSITVHNYK